MNKNGINRTVIISVAIFSLVLILVAYRGVMYIEKFANSEKEKAIAMRTLTETRDRFTVCIQTVMSESRLSNKPIDAEKAKDICAQVEKY